MLKTFVIGHLGKDAVVNNVGGKSVINFSIGVNQGYKNAQGVKVEKTTWVDCAMWRDSVAVAQYLRKGTQVFCEGGIEAGTYQKSDGTTVATLKLRVNDLQLLGGNSGGTQSNAPVLGAVEETNIGNDTSDLPF